MEDPVMEERWNLFDEQLFQYYYHDESCDMSDFMDVAESESTQSPFNAWTDLLGENGTKDCWSTTEITSVEEEFLQIIYSSQKSEESMTVQPQEDKNGVHSCSHNQEAVKTDYSSGNKNASFDCDGFFPSNTDSEEYRGLRLVHLLTACAEAISHGAHDLAEIIFCRLTELVSPTGSTMERAAYYLSRSLRQTHVELIGGTGNGDHMCRNMFKAHESGLSTRDPNFIGAFCLLNLVYPYVRFAHFTANQSILEAVPAKPKMPFVLHVVDFDIMEGLQWPPLMEALKSDEALKSLCALKVSAVKWPEDDEGGGDDDDDEEEEERFGETGRRLCEYAREQGIPFCFQEMELENLRRKEGEVIAVNCMWELPHMRKRSKKKLEELFNGVRHLKPDVLIVGSGPVGMDRHEKLDFLERFSECLRNLCAVFDSTQVGLGKNSGLLGPMWKISSWGRRFADQ